tara:strand:+ start:1268 stop:1465 length:198 start_codon:yes stop_codon:yes gene_type:complete
MEDKQEKPTLSRRFKRFIIESKRVLKVTKKPGKEEFKVIVKVTGIGIFVIGLLGFLIQIGWALLT